MERTPTNRLRYFPVRHAIGVDISDVSVELLELSRTRSGLFVRSSSRAELAPGIVHNGEILDAARLQTVLKETLAAAQPHAFHTLHAIVALPETRVFLRAFEFPLTLSEEQVRRAVPFEAEGALPLTVEEIYYDIQFHRSRAATHHVLFAAAPRRIVDTYLTTLQAAGLQPVALDVESAALARSIVGAREDPVLVVDIGGRATVISVVEREMVHTTVTLPVAGDALTEHIIQMVRSGREEAEQRKRTEGLHTADAQLRESLTEGLIPIIQEIRRTTQYHEAHTGRAVSELYLAGGSAQLPGIVEHFAQHTGIRTQIGDPWTTRTIRIPDTVREQGRMMEARGALATVVGLALRGVSSDSASAGMNLLPPTVRERYTGWKHQLVTATLALLTAAATLLLAMTMTTMATVRTLDVQRTRSDAERLRTVFRGAEFLKAVEETRRVNAEVSSLRTVLHDVPDTSALIASLRTRVPAGIAIQRLEVTIPPEATGSITMHVTGLADRRETFLAFEHTLRDVPRLQKLDSPPSNLNRKEHAPFSVTLTLARQ